MDDLELIKQKINIVDLISEYLPLKKSGVNFKALCPFHQEKTPSFVVSPERGIFHCFSCGVGGDQFKFLMLKDGMEFVDALELLAGRAGVILTRKPTKDRDKKTKLFDANQKAAQYFNFILTEHRLGKPALEYLKKRGLSDKTIKEFNLGYSPNSWDSLFKFMVKRGFIPADLIDAGLSVESKSGGYDRFRGRIMFPLFDTKGQIIAFSGRILNAGEPKYINTPQTIIFDKSSCLYGLNMTKGEIRQKNVAILTEGEMDMIMSYQSGVRNVVASKGTALTSGQIDLVKKYTDTILLCFDADLAGDTASRRGIEMADATGLNIKVIKIPEGKDPAELSLKNPELWVKAVAEAEPVYDYYLQSVSSRFNRNTAEGRKRIAAELAPLWVKISDTVTREFYIQKLSALIAIPEDILRREITKAGSSYVPTFENIIKQDGGGKEMSRSRRGLLEEYLMTLLLKIPADLTYVPNFPETIFTLESFRSLYVLLVLYLDAISFKAAAFNISDFVKTVPEELVPIVDGLYLTEIDDKLSSSKAWQDEINVVVNGLKKALVKASLEKLSDDIKNAQSFGKMEQLQVLNKRFRDLSLKLKNL